LCALRLPGLDNDVFDEVIGYNAIQLLKRPTDVFFAAASGYTFHSDDIRRQLVFSHAQGREARNHEHDHQFHHVFHVSIYSSG